MLIGLPGSGKSTVAQAFGRSAGRPVFVMDELLEAEAGTTIARIFAERGEAYFRQQEAALLRQLLSDHPDAIIDGGGGLITQQANRSLLAASATTAWLDAPDEILVARLAGATDRPLLAGDPAARLRELRRERLVNYTDAADVIVPTAGLDEDQTVARLQAALDSAPPRAGHRLIEEVKLADGRSYPVVVGRGVVDELDSLIPSRSVRVAVVTQAGIGIEVDSGRDQRVFVVEDGEQAKRLDVVGRLASQFADWGMTRADCVVSIGGGVVSDLAGFTAASYHRGIPVVHISTTLLGQIDAAIGGKTGVNLPEGKNLVGAFWQPEAVICDVDHLGTLPPREFRSGMGELAKYHFLGGGRLDEATLVDRVARSVRIKADVVGGDEREGGRRAILNYGHTLAHALETAGKYDLRHGEAVGIGLIYAAELANRLGRIDRARVDEHRRVVTGYGLDTSIPPGFDHQHLIDLFSRDKKAIDGVTFVLDGPGGVEPLRVDDRTVLADALTAVS